MLPTFSQVYCFILLTSFLKNRFGKYIIQTFALRTRGFQFKFSHTEDKSEPSGATLSFLPLLPAAGMITCKFHPSFRLFATVFETIKTLVLGYFYLGILLYTDFSASLPTVCFGVSVNFASAPLLKVSRIFLAFRASVYYHRQNPSCFNWHQKSAHTVPCCLLSFSASPHRRAETSPPQYPASGLVTATSILGWLTTIYTPSYTIYLSKRFLRNCPILNR